MRAREGDAERAGAFLLVGCGLMSAGSVRRWRARVWVGVLMQGGREGPCSLHPPSQLVSGAGCGVGKAHSQSGGPGRLWDVIVSFVRSSRVPALRDEKRRDIMVAAWGGECLSVTCHGGSVWLVMNRATLTRRTGSRRAGSLWHG